MLKDIPNYEGRYAVTKDGEVWSYPKYWYGHKHDGMFLKHTRISGGYPAVSLITNGKPLAFGVHRLVAMTYVPNPHNKPHVNHIDYDRTNPSASNLEWVTRSENTYHSAKVGKYSRRGISNGRYKYSEEQRRHIRTALKLGIMQAEVSRMFGIAQSTVRLIRVEQE